MLGLLLVLLLLLPGSLAAQYRESHGFKLPSQKFTPGAVLTKDTAVVCHRKTGTVRNVTMAEKIAVSVHYGLHYCKRTGKGLGSWLCPIGSNTGGAAYEQDHKVALEDGGSNDSTNIYPQPWLEARIKDKVENRVHKLACTGKLNLADAQKKMRSDWTQLLIPADTAHARQPGQKAPVKHVPADSVNPLLNHGA